MTYSTFINNIIQTRGQWGINPSESFEAHHIMPKCLGGTGSQNKKDSNIIWLYPEEHYIAHKLLALEHSDNKKLVYAWHMMAFKHSWSQSRDYKISAEDCALAKALCNAAKSRPVLCIETNTVYESVNAARKAFSDNNITQALSGKRERAAGYHWAYADDTEKIVKLKKFKGQAQKLKTKRIICIETGETFNKVVDAAKKYNILRSTISYCLIGQCQTAGGYHWAYLKDTAQRQKLSQFIGALPMSSSNRQALKLGHRVICKELNKHFPSAKAAATWINNNYNYKIASGNIMSVCYGKRKTTAGFHWEFEKEQN